jgi:exodeoxyribonuclease-3
VKLANNLPSVLVTSVGAPPGLNALRSLFEAGEFELVAADANKYSPGFTDEERQDFKNYLALGLVDIHRHLNPDTPEIYTWWSNRIGARSRNAGWRIDIFLISQSLTDRVQQSLIHPKDMGSDHCPIELQIEI